MTSETVARAVVVGAGTMGAGIAATFANAGIAVALVDAAPDALERARATLAALYASAVERGRLASEDAAARLARIAFAPGLDAVEALDAVDVAVEAVYEDLALKREIFAALGARASPRALLATNTSTLDVDAIGAAAPHPERTLGLHFFSPAHVMRLVEVVRGAATSPPALASAIALVERLGKTPVVVGNADGFVGNRMLLGYKREAELLALAGVPIERVDAVLERFGFAMGPFAVSDLAGIDVGWRAKRERIARGAAPPFVVTDLPDALVAAGRLGAKTNAGYYRYAPGSRRGLPDSALDAFVAAERARLGIVVRDVDDDEIIERCVYALVNDGFRLLDAGVAASEADVDTVWRDGYGFPAARGGPMRYARDVGLAQVLARVETFARGDPTFWTPAAGLQAAAAADLNALRERAMTLASRIRIALPFRRVTASDLDEVRAMRARIAATGAAADDEVLAELTNLGETLDILST
jgi:3-hydroxyacyl-CoA dehydrogenase